MTVKGLMPGLMEVGKIKIGIKGELTKSKDGNEFRLPQKIDHFRLVKNERDENDDYLPDENLLKILKDNPAAMYDSKKNLIGIPIKLLYNDIDLVFPTQYVSYVAGKVSCSGNGEIAHTRDDREVTCPCSRLESAYTGKDKCKVNGTLSCLIEGANVGGCYKFRTTSGNSTRFILSSLMVIKAITGGLLAFLPLRLIINPKKTVIPGTGAPTTIYVVTVEYQGSIEELQQKALTMGSERISLIENMKGIEREAKMVLISDVDSDREEREIAEEFYPESIVVDKGTGEIIEAETVEKVKPEEVKETSPDVKFQETKKTPFNKKLKDEPKKEAKKDLLGKKKEVKAKDEEKVEPDLEKTEPKGIDFKRLEDLKAKKASESIDMKKEFPEPVTREQLFKVIKLKKDLKILDKDKWVKLIKSMKFPGIETTVKEMTEEQGNAFIELLESKIKNPT